MVCSAIVRDLVVVWADDKIVTYLAPGGKVGDLLRAVSPLLTPLYTIEKLSTSLRSAQEVTCDKCKSFCEVSSNTAFNAVHSRQDTSIHLDTLYEQQR